MLYNSLKHFILMDIMSIILKPHTKVYVCGLNKFIRFVVYFQSHTAQDLH